MVKYSIGYNYDLKLLDLLEIFRDHISGLYFPIPQRFMGSGRALKENADYEKDIPKLIRKCNELGIRSELLLNATCEGEKDCSDKIINYIKELKEKGLTSVIVTNPIYISKIKEKINIEVESSVNCYVKELEHAQFLKQLGADVITIDRDINRNLELIKKIKEKTGAKLKMLVNEGCLRNCPFRKIHFNMISHAIETNEFDRYSCIQIIKKNPHKVFSIPFVRPEDIKHYEGLIDYFKLATRTMNTGKIGLLLDAYIKQKYDGDLLFLLSTKSLFEYFNAINNSILTKNNFFENVNNEEFCKKLLKEAAESNR